MRQQRVRGTSIIGCKGLQGPSRSQKCGVEVRSVGSQSCLSALVVKLRHLGGEMPEERGFVQRVPEDLCVRWQSPRLFGNWLVPASLYPTLYHTPLIKTLYSSSFHLMIISKIGRAHV